MTFNDFNLHRHLIGACEKNGFKQPTPIQNKSIPEILQGKDVMACAQTGTGKTAAFTLPLISNLLMDTNTKTRSPKVLVLTPTRELAEQILTSINTFTKGTQLKTGVVVGGVAYGPQLKMLRNGVDLLVATPGRLIDHLNEGKVDLSATGVLVLDEADRMLDMGFVKPVETIANAAAKQRQTLLFSATFTPEVDRLAKRFLTTPTQIRLATSTQKHDGITQSIYYASGRVQKQDLLKTLLEDQKIWQAIIFMRTKHATDRLAKTLNTWGHDAAALHGDMRQSKRKKVIERMHKGNLKVLVATDVAARGLDVKDLTHVFNFDLPQVAEDYIHRVGRTGRAGAKGTAVSFVSNEERKLLHAIEKTIGRKITVEGDVPTLKPFKANTNSGPRPKAKFGGKPNGKTGGKFNPKAKQKKRTFQGKSEGKFEGKKRGKPAEQQPGQKTTNGNSAKPNQNRPWQNKNKKPRRPRPQA